MAKNPANAPQSWNPQTEPARTVKKVLVQLAGTPQVFLNSTISGLGLSAAVVQTRMNTKFWPNGEKSLTEEQCGLGVTAGQLTLTIAGML
jgi:hypothetical protein